MDGSVAQTMLCGTCVAPGQFALTESPLPQNAPDGWVLVDIDAVGLCGTDFHIFEGKHPFLDYPRVIGHELSGHVALAAKGWAKGQPVVINPYVSCGTCTACRKGKPNCCTGIAVMGVHRDGGMCARIAVPSGNLYDASALPKGAAVLTEFLAIGAHAVRRAAPQPGDTVLVTGAGPIGLGVALFARLRGAIVHLRDASPARLAAAAGFGFADLHGVDDALPEGGFDVVFDATGNARAIQAGFAHVAHGGTYVLVSVVKDDITFSDPEFHKREMTLMGSRNATAIDFATVMQALTDDSIDAARIISETLPLQDLPTRFPALVANREALIKVVVQIGGQA
ncbi:MAG: zinc-binding alcohol dehydrogenase family protein [Pseudotabrizicola sp.]|uniref:zinc-binding alcohol dehydrogenase family protein n=1 Tax=Pseudotabrizicola sp. TaxID=2939647 RepID=UPI00271A25D4|nr:zinc-binding alcohol dehydrogenase family protein [Pseudotabrizicola sp.]MDO8884712.1 zinc-binding alcohol dehydrogenase family protein [Pseudotabrizicola sp.]MDP2082562.1 zinc-binding alcohol dehydrogenase family protein [Pseudotabrizicola sp.]MDZ7573927.1 zinc-binding alcohol dehydrogenase family protein [Pseudotabrizicola sp.]